MSMRRLDVESVAEGLLELLESRGVRCFFGGGAGTDFPPVIKAFAKRQALGRSGGLRPITVAHEITAVAMAHGYFKVEGKPMGVLCHGTVGLQHAAMAIYNAYCDRVPVYILARNQGIHWAQESFDQAGLLREFVKWDYELRRGDQLETVVDRALAVACSPPAGPVYLTLPLDVIGEPMPPLTVSASARLRPSCPSQPVPAALRRAAQTLAGAANPLAITSSLGRDPTAPEALVDLADRLGLPVAETWPTHLNFPRDHPMHQGFDAGTLVGEADVVLAIESDAPWFPALAEPPRGAVVIQIDDDPLYETYPIRGFPTDIGLAGHAGSTLRALAAELYRLPLDESAIAARRRRWAAAHGRRREAWRTAGDAARDTTPLDYAWISKCLGDVLDARDIVVTEIVLDPTPGLSHASRHVLQPRPLGGARLGPGSRARRQARAPRPHRGLRGRRRQPHLRGADGDPPHRPRLRPAGAVRGLQQRRLGTHPPGHARLRPGGLGGPDPVDAAVRSGASPAYDAICEANGGYGERVEDPAQLSAALARALDVVRRERRQALLDVIAR